MTEHFQQSSSSASSLATEETKTTAPGPLSLPFQPTPDVTRSASSIGKKSQKHVTSIHGPGDLSTLLDETRSIVRPVVDKELVEQLAKQLGQLSIEPRKTAPERKWDEELDGIIGEPPDRGRALPWLDKPGQWTKEEIAKALEKRAVPLESKDVHALSRLCTALAEEGAKQPDQVRARFQVAINFFSGVEKVVNSFERKYPDIAALLRAQPEMTVVILSCWLYYGQDIGTDVIAVFLHHPDYLEFVHKPVFKFPHNLYRFARLGNLVLNPELAKAPSVQPTHKSAIHLEVFLWRYFQKGSKDCQIFEGDMGKAKTDTKVSFAEILVQRLFGESTNTVINGDAPHVRTIFRESGAGDMRKLMDELTTWTHPVYIAPRLSKHVKVASELILGTSQENRRLSQEVDRLTAQNKDLAAQVQTEAGSTMQWRKVAQEHMALGKRDSELHRTVIGERDGYAAQLVQANATIRNLQGQLAAKPAANTEEVQQQFQSNYARGIADGKQEQREYDNTQARALQAEWEQKMQAAVGEEEKKTREAEAGKVAAIALSEQEKKRAEHELSERQATDRLHQAALQDTARTHELLEQATQDIAKLREQLRLTEEQNSLLKKESQALVKREKMHQGLVGLTRNIGRKKVDRYKHAIRDAKDLESLRRSITDADPEEEEEEEKDEPATPTSSSSSSSSSSSATTTPTLLLAPASASIPSASVSTSAAIVSSSPALGSSASSSSSLGSPSAKLATSDVVGRHNELKKKKGELPRDEKDVAMLQLEPQDSLLLDICLASWSKDNKKDGPFCGAKFLTTTDFKDWTIGACGDCGKDGEHVFHHLNARMDSTGQTLEGDPMGWIADVNDEKFTTYSGETISMLRHLIWGILILRRTNAISKDEPTTQANDLVDIPTIGTACDDDVNWPKGVNTAAQFKKFFIGLGRLAAIVQKTNAKDEKALRTFYHAELLAVIHSQHLSLGAPRTFTMINGGSVEMTPLSALLAWAEFLSTTTTTPAKEKKGGPSAADMSATSSSVVSVPAPAVTTPTVSAATTSSSFSSSSLASPMAVSAVAPIAPSSSSSASTAGATATSPPPTEKTDIQRLAEFRKACKAVLLAIKKTAASRGTVADGMITRYCETIQWNSVKDQKKQEFAVTGCQAIAEKKASWNPTFVEELSNWITSNNKKSKQTRANYAARPRELTMPNGKSTNVAVADALIKWSIVTGERLGEKAAKGRHAEPKAPHGRRFSRRRHC